MAWIELHQEFRNHPKIARLAAALKCDKAAAHGYMICLWLWAVGYARDGELTGFQDIEIADGAIHGIESGIVKRKQQQLV